MNMMLCIIDVWLCCQVITAASQWQGFDSFPKPLFLFNRAALYLSKHNFPHNARILFDKALELAAACKDSCMKEILEKVKLSFFYSWFKWGFYTKTLLCLTV